VGEFQLFVPFFLSSYPIVRISTLLGDIKTNPKSMIRAYRQEEVDVDTDGGNDDGGCGPHPAARMEATKIRMPPISSCWEGCSPRTNSPSRVVNTGSIERITFASAAGTEACAFCWQTSAIVHGPRAV